MVLPGGKHLRFAAMAKPNVGSLRVSEMQKFLRTLLCAFIFTRLILLPGGKHLRFAAMAKPNVGSPRVSEMQKFPRTLLCAEEFWYSRRESNPQLPLRRGPLYPFNYGSIIYKKQNFVLNGCNGTFCRAACGERRRACATYPFNYGSIIHKKRLTIVQRNTTSYAPSLDYRYILLHYATRCQTTNVGFFIF